MLGRSGDDPSTTSSSANWGRTDVDMDRLDAPSATDSRPECIPEDAHYVPVSCENPWYRGCRMNLCGPRVFVLGAAQWRHGESTYC
jgi:hypothetical protein